MSLVTTPAVLLRSFPYGETSRILKLMARDLGLVGVVAKGVRKRGGRGGGALETFSTGSLTIHMKQTRELQTFREFEPTRRREGLGRDLVRFGGASLVAELVLRHAGEEESAGLFAALERALDDLEEAGPSSLVATLLAGAWHVVSVLGYRPALDACVACGAALDGDGVGRFDFSAGGVRCPACGEGTDGPRVGPGAREQLRALLGGEVIADLTRPRGHLRLLSDFVTFHVSGSRPLDSFDFLDRVLPDDDA